MAVPKYVAFQFLPEDRQALAAALAAHPAAAREQDGRYRIAAAGGACSIELGADHGTVVFTPGEGDEALSLAQDILTQGGAVFTACC